MCSFKFLSGVVFCFNCSFQELRYFIRWNSEPRFVFQLFRKKLILIDYNILRKNVLMKYRHARFWKSIVVPVSQLKFDQFKKQAQSNNYPHQNE